MSITVNWDDVPEEYEWFAINGYGDGYVCKNKPKLVSNAWYESSGWKNCKFSGEYLDWRETLQQRPKKVVTLQENTDYSVHIHLDSDTDSLTYCGRLSKEQVIKIMEVVYES